MIGETPQLFAKSCTGKGGIWRPKKSIKGYRCNLCQVITDSSMMKPIMSILKRGHEKFQRICCILNSSELSISDTEYLKQVLHTNKETLTTCGKDLYARAKLHVE